MRAFYVGVLGMTEVDQARASPRPRRRRGSGPGRPRSTSGIEDGFAPPARPTQGSPWRRRADWPPRSSGSRGAGGVGRHHPRTAALPHRGPGRQPARVPAGAGRVSAGRGLSRAAVRARRVSRVSRGSSGPACGAAAGQLRAVGGRQLREQRLLLLDEVGHRRVDDVAARRRQAHEHPAPVARVGAPLDEAAALEPVDAVGHRARRDERLLDELARARARRARRRGAAPRARRRPSRRAGAPRTPTRGPGRAGAPAERPGRAPPAATRRGPGAPGARPRRSRRRRRRACGRRSCANS